MHVPDIAKEARRKIGANSTATSVGSIKRTWLGGKGSGARNNGRPVIRYLSTARDCCHTRAQYRT
eukprot:996762-Rhodomonas_salina.1